MSTPQTTRVTFGASSNSEPSAGPSGPNTVRITRADQELARASREADQVREQQARSVSVHVGGTTERFNGLDASTTSSGITKINMADRPVGGGILQTGQRHGSNVPASGLTPDSTVEVNGMRMAVKTAEKLG